jgi:hypothetical protein
MVEIWKQNVLNVNLRVSITSAKQILKLESVSVAICEKKDCRRVCGVEPCECDFVVERLGGKYEK